jgi:group II intron reverse transcriptase/maturase
MIFEERTKSIPITKEMVWEAYKLVKKNKGSAGVDLQTLAEFERVRVKELYKLWNRMASGSYFANKVKRVEIEKEGGKLRPLGIPTVCDRIAQQVVKTYLEPRLEAEFMDNSYGYRPNKSAHQAVAEVQSKVRKYKWVIDLDIQEFFENVDHELLYKALAVHVAESWVMLYIRRWLEAPVQLSDGTHQYPKGKGTPQGGVISPLLSNLYLHYCIDKWLSIHYPEVKMVRYADDMIVHCNTENQAIKLLDKIRHRFSECGLTVHAQKTKIVYCKKEGRPLKGKTVQFDFLGFSFQPMITRLRKGGVFLQYDCKMSRKSKKRILRALREMELHKKSQSTIQDLALLLNSKIRGWINYYGKVSRKSLKPVFYYLHHRLIKWILNKYKRFKRSRVLAVKWLRRVTVQYPNLFYHWALGYQLT